eukprot:TRINITY_DN1208_c2_g1_i2.p1 TRINITY_DN1208_c2_g1~~TRINITY_DN1208_c2_g1_i2.p1  ORF type:complete len:119 (+),score=17.27 TRINITY_DN1208_c2_g1_i2:171-527(+)
MNMNNIVLKGFLTQPQIFAFYSLHISNPTKWTPKALATKFFVEETTAQRLLKHCSMPIISAGPLPERANQAPWMIGHPVNYVVKRAVSRMYFHNYLLQPYVNPKAKKNQGWNPSNVGL